LQLMQDGNMCEPRFRGKKISGELHEYARDDQIADVLYTLEASAKAITAAKI